MANTKNFIAKNGVSTGDGYAMPDVRPSLLLDFANSKTLDPRITFTRGSTGTYWDGKTTTKAEENLAERSNSFTSAYWSKIDVTVTEGATAPDGSTTATTLQSAVSSDPTQAVYHLMSPVPQIGASLSVYAKEGTTEFFSLQAATSNPNALFNLNTGAVLASTGCTATITSVGNGWYRCALENLTVAGNYIMMSPVGSDIGTGDAWGNNDAQAGDNVLIWGVQLENRSSPTAYTATGGSPIVKYQPTLQTAASGEARFDHDPVTGESKGLLIEEARTNNLTYSEQIDNSDWTKSGAYVTANTMIAPDGTQTADKLSENTANSSHDLRQTFTGSPSTVYTYSFYAKAGERSEITFFAALSSGSAGGSFNLATGVATSAYMYPVGNGWYRCYVPIATASSGGALNMILILNNGSASSYTGDGYSGLYFWGLQLELGSFPTSYIPTSGSTVTRSLDSAEITGTSFTAWFGHEATSYVELSSPAWEVDDFDMAYISDGTTNNRIRHNVVLADPRAQIRSNATNYFAYSPAVFNVVTNNSIYRAALAYSSTEAAFSYNGVAPFTDSSVFVSPELNQMDLTKNAGVAHFKKFAFYPQRLSNATLQAMTEE
jgi:hypothetical protein